MVIKIVVLMGRRNGKLRGWESNRVEDKRHINIMFRYSDMNRRENRPPENSVLNPETSSLSPSTKSNGARFVSARQVVNQIRATDGRIRRVIVLRLFRVLILNVRVVIKIDRRIRAILIS